MIRASNIRISTILTTDCPCSQVLYRKTEGTPEGLYL